MNLIVPGVGLTLGPQWATDINSSLAIIDQHNHAPGSGVPITPAGLNISADLTFNGNNAYDLRTVRFSPQTSAPIAAADIGCLYEVGVDLFYTDGNGASIRITQSGGIAGTPGSISGLVSPASASYVSGSSKFVWQSNANVPADMDFGSAILRNLLVNSKGLTLAPPTMMAVDYTITLPTLPSVQSFVTLDSFGNMAAPWTVDGVTVKVISNQIVAAASGIGDGISINDNGSNQLQVRNLVMERAFEANGLYSSAPMPQTGIDGLLIFNYNATITAIYIVSQTSGSSGITEYDVKLASPAGSFASILSVTGKIDSTAAAPIWTDSGSVVGAQTGVTKPALSTTAVSAGQALRFDILSGMVGASNASLIVQFKAR